MKPTDADKYILKIALENWSPSFIAQNFGYKLNDVLAYKTRLALSNIDEISKDYHEIENGLYKYRVFEVMEKHNLSRNQIARMITSGKIKKRNQDISIKIRPEIVLKALEMFYNGKTKPQIIQKLKICRNQLYYILKKYNKLAKQQETK